MSCSIYLVHAPFVSAARILFGRLVPNGHPIFLIGIFLSMFVGLATSCSFFRWIESPLERWQKSLGRPRPSSPSSP
jgi:peptidoglycan/LPS O-acetylase OafA/YrhL